MLKKYYGNTLEEAREKARKELGVQKIAVLETVPPKDGFLASVTVLISKPNQSADSEQAPVHNRNYSRADLFPRSLKKIKKIVTGTEKSGKPDEDTSALKNESTEQKSNHASLNGGQHSNKAELNGAQVHPEKHFEQSNFQLAEKNSSIKETLTKPKNSSGNGHKRTEFEKIFNRNGLSDLAKNPDVMDEIRSLSTKVDQLEAMLSEHIISPSLRYLNHPVYQQLLQKGITASDISMWFREVLGEGIDPESESNSFAKRIARILRRRFPNGVASSHKPKKFNAFYGDSGAGKTTLIMKLASRAKADNQRIALITLYDHEDEKLSKLGVFAQQNGIDHFFIGTRESAEPVLKKLQSYDRILIDTPSLGHHADEIVKKASSIQKFMEQLPDFESHLVINAALNNEFFSEQYLSRYPLKPDFLAVSHLDQVSVWGHLLTLFNCIKSKPQYLTTGPQLRGDIITYTPEWFANKILNDQNS